MTKRNFNTYIHLQPVLAQHCWRNHNHRHNILSRTEHGLLLSDCDGIEAYYEEKNSCFVQFDELEPETHNYRDIMIEKIYATGRKIDTYIYLFQFPYALRDYRMQVWIDYSPLQWDEIISLDYAPILYDFDDIFSEFLKTHDSLLV